MEERILDYGVIYTFDFLMLNFNKIPVGTKIISSKGDVYELREQIECGKHVRKFSRANGTKLRFMTYENINETFKLFEEEIDIQNIKEIEINTFMVDTNTLNTLKINEVIKAVKQLDKKIKELGWNE